MAKQVAAWSPWERPPAVAGSAPLYGTSPYYVFVVGPVQSVHALHRNPEDVAREFIPIEPVVTERHVSDVTRGWPRLPTVKQKEVKLCLEHTVKLSLFCEGSKSRRTLEATQQRQEKAVKRWQEKPWPST